MDAGTLFRSIKGTEGKIMVPGLGAVVATFSEWTLKRREESHSAGPRWTLHGVLSYANESMVKSDKVGKRITLVLNSQQKFELCSWESLRLEGTSLLVEGVVQCP